MLVAAGPLDLLIQISVKIPAIENARQVILERLLAEDRGGLVKVISLDGIPKANVNIARVNWLGDNTIRAPHEGSAGRDTPSRSHQQDGLFRFDVQELSNNLDSARFEFDVKKDEGVVVLLQHGDGIRSARGLYRLKASLVQELYELPACRRITIYDQNLLVGHRRPPYSAHCPKGGVSILKTNASRKIFPKGHSP